MALGAKWKKTWTALGLTLLFAGAVGACAYHRHRVQEEPQIHVVEKNRGERETSRSPSSPERKYHDRESGVSFAYPASWGDLPSAELSLVEQRRVLRIGHLDEYDDVNPPRTHLRIQFDSQPSENIKEICSGSVELEPLTELLECKQLAGRLALFLLLDTDAYGHRVRAEQATGVTHYPSVVIESPLFDGNARSETQAWVEGMSRLLETLTFPRNP